MNISNITVKSFQEIILVHSKGNKTEQMVCRPSYGISLCKRGKIEYKHHGKTYISKPNTVLILPRHQSYEINRIESGEFPVINFQATEQFTDDFCEIPVHDGQKFILIFEEMQKTKFERNNHLKMMKIFYHLLDELNTEIVEPNVPIQKFINFMNKNYSNPDLSIHEIASFGNISEIYLRKLFNKYLQVSPKQYLIHLRISKSKELFESTNLSVDQVSKNCGYSTVYHFCRSFKNICKCTPSEYRKMTRTQLI